MSKPISPPNSSPMSICSPTTATVPFYNVYVNAKELMKATEASSSNDDAHDNKSASNTSTIIESPKLKDIFFQICSQFYLPALSRKTNDHQTHNTNSSNTDHGRSSSNSSTTFSFLTSKTSSPAHSFGFTASNLVIEPLTGGITNSLFKISFLPLESNSHTSNSLSVHPPPCVIRCFGPNTDEIINRKRELVIADFCSSSGIGVTIYGAFRNGRIEEFRKVHTLEPYELKVPAQMKEISRKLFEFHQLPFEAPELHSKLSTAALVSSLPLHSSISSNPNLKNCAYISPLFTLLPSYLDKVKEYAASATPSSSHTSSDETFAHLAKFWEEELNAALDILSRCSFTFDNQNYALCHNDLLSGNILVEQSKYDLIEQYTKSPSNFEEPVLTDSDMFLIDFEYADWNLIAYDIANHFCEMCGFDCDWKAYPSEDEQLSFITSYLSNRSNIDTSKRSNNVMFPVSHIDASELLTQVKAMVVFPHLFWGIWALIQSKQSLIDFDYFQYSILRKKGYLLMKDKSLQVLNSLCL